MNVVGSNLRVGGPRLEVCSNGRLLVRAVLSGQASARREMKATSWLSTTFGMSAKKIGCWTSSSFSLTLLHTDPCLPPTGNRPAPRPTPWRRAAPTSAPRNSVSLTAPTRPSPPLTAPTPDIEGHVRWRCPGRCLARAANPTARATTTSSRGGTARPRCPSKGTTAGTLRGAS